MTSAQNHHSVNPEDASHSTPNLRPVGGNTRTKVVCGDLTFVLTGWWHDSPMFCNHYATERDCSHGGGEWRPVYVLFDPDQSGRGQNGELDRIAEKLAEQKADGTARRFDDVDAIREHLGQRSGGES